MEQKLIENETINVPAANPAKAKSYERVKLVMSLVSMSLNFVIPILFLLLRGSEAIRNLAEGWTGSAALIVVIYLLISGAGLQAIEFPFEFF